MLGGPWPGAVPLLEHASQASSAAGSATPPPGWLASHRYEGPHRIVSILMSRDSWPYVPEIAAGRNEPQYFSGSRYSMISLVRLAKTGGTLKLIPSSSNPSSVSMPFGFETVASKSAPLGVRT